MLLIIMHHYAVHGFNGEVLQTINWDWHLVNWFGEGGRLGVAIFVMISGYYMVESKYTLKKFLKLWGEVLFYNLLIFTLFHSILEPVKEIEFDFLTVFHEFFPLTYYRYWFVSAYVLLMICSPFINKILHSFSSNQLKAFILVLLFTQILLPTVSAATNQLSLFGDFILCYLIAGYIRLYHSKNDKAKKHLIAAICLYVLLMICTTYDTKYREIYSIVVFLLARELLLFFILLKPKYNKLIQMFSSATFGIYLIHDNEYMRYYLWQTVFHNQTYYGENQLWKHAFIVVIIVYCGCTIIDLLRQITIEKLWLRIVDRYLVPLGETCKNTCIAINNWIVCTKNKLFSKEDFRNIKIQFVLALLISVVLITFGFYLLVLEIMRWQAFASQKLYVLRRYVVPLVYMAVPLVLAMFIAFGFAFKRSKKRGIIFELIRAFLALACTCLTLKIYGCGYRTLFIRFIKEYKYDAYFVWFIMLMELLICFFDKKTIQEFREKYYSLDIQSVYTE